MNVKEMMTRRVHTVGADAPLRDAAAGMDSANVGALAVCESDRLVGIITDRDIVIRSISAGQDPNVTAVRDAMTSPAIYCFEDQPVEDAARMMQSNEIRRLPVLNREHRMTGFVSLDDLATSAGQAGLSNDVLKAVSEATKRAA